jgi:hypothetical protein
MNFTYARVLARANIKIIAAAISLTVLACLLVGFVRFMKQLDSYYHVRLGDDREEVLYRLGSPPFVLGEPEKGDWGYWQKVFYTDNSDPKNAMPADKSINDFYSWSYRPDSSVIGTGSITVMFAKVEKQVRSISCMDDEFRPAGVCPDLVGVAIGDSEEDVQRKLGEPMRFKRDGVSKTLRYDDIGVEFLLTKGKVYQLRKVQPNGPVGQIALRYLHTFAP